MYDEKYESKPWQRRQNVARYFVGAFVSFFVMFAVFSSGAIETLNNRSHSPTVLLAHHSGIDNNAVILPPNSVRLSPVENTSVVEGLDAFRHFLIDPVSKNLCKKIKAIGQGYGEWKFCLDRPMPKGSLVYGIGVGENWDFDKYLASSGAEVFSFDCSQNYSTHLAPGVIFDKTCLAGHTGFELYKPRKVHRPMATVCELINRNKHYGRYMHVLKIDCEGCEWRALERFFQGCAGLLPQNIGQLLMEIHFSVKKGIYDVEEYKRMLRVFASLKGHGFEVFHREVAWGGELYRELLPEVREALMLRERDRDFMGYNLHLINTALREVPAAIPFNGS